LGAKRSEILVRGLCNHFAVTADKEQCAVDGFADPSLCLCVCVFLYIYIYMCKCVCICIYLYLEINMDLLLWGRKCSEYLVRGICNHFAVTADKGPCVLYGFACLSLCVCVCVYINMCMCMCICIYIYKVTWTSRCVCASATKTSCVVLQSFRLNCRKWAVRGRWTCWPVSVCMFIYMYVCICIYI
jgi:hypothetical protein